MIQPSDPVSIADRSIATGICLEDSDNLIAQFGGHPLVGIDDEDPRVSHLRDGPVFLGRGVGIFVLNDPDAASASDLGGAVSAKRIDDEDFIGPGYTIQAGFNISLFIESRDQGCYLDLWCRFRNHRRHLKPHTDVIVSMSPTHEQFNYPAEADPSLVRDLTGRLNIVHERMAEAASRAGRDPASVSLIAVSKTFGIDTVRAGSSAGLNIFGENRVQEALEKMDRVGGTAQWHLIGHLQRNKAAVAVGRFAWIHSVDSVRLIQELEKQAALKEVQQRVLLQVNVSGEGSKFGISPDHLSGLIEAIEASPHLMGEGLMTIPPWDPRSEAARPHFARLRQLLKSIEPSTRFTPLHLSMGMSHDFEVAIEEGATMVRVGSAIFGPRP
jgi:pyridoxal phosphate enzyme (YggS family)